MLERTFIHIPGIGPKTEQKPWDEGIHTWEIFLDRGEAIISPARDDFISQELEASLKDKAVRLWQAYQWGDDKALETLIRYNSADILNLKPLMKMGYSEMKGKYNNYCVSK